MGNQMTVLVTLLQPNQQGLPDRAEYLAQRQPVSQKLNLMRTLQRNFKTCVKAAQKNKDPSERERHEEPEMPTPQDPKGRCDNFNHKQIVLYKSNGFYY